MQVEHLSSALQRLEKTSNEQNFVRLEELCEQTATSLAVIHRFMAAQVEEREEEETDSRAKSRTVSERSNQEASPEKYR